MRIKVFSRYQRLITIVVLPVLALFLFHASSVEILKPEKYQLSAGEAHNILNTMAEMMHRFAAAGFGGIVIARGGNQG